MNGWYSSLLYKIKLESHPKKALWQKKRIYGLWNNQKKLQLKNHHQ
jgi:hypothetical protein